MRNIDVISNDRKFPQAVYAKCFWYTYLINGLKYGILAYFQREDRGEREKKQNLYIIIIFPFFFWDFPSVLIGNYFKFTILNKILSTYVEKYFYFQLILHSYTKYSV